MKYLNPFHIINTDLREGEKINATLLKRAKKRLFSEFELFGKTTILIGEQEFDKNAILVFFDDLEKEQALFQHWQIFQNKPLLALLEQGDLDFFKRSNALTDVLADKNLAKYTLPYLVYQINEALYDAVRKMDIRTTRLLSEKVIEIPNQHETTAYQKTYRYLRGKVQDVAFTAKSLLNTKERVLDSEIEAFLHPSFMAVFNFLPAHYFGQIRNEYALKLEDIAINLHNIFRRTALAIEAIEAGLELQIDEVTTGRLNHILTQLHTKNGGKIPPRKTGKRTSEREKKKARRMKETSIFWAIQAILVLMYLLRKL